MRQWSSAGMILVMRLIEGRALPDLKTCQKFSRETEVKLEGSIMKNEMASVLLLVEKICFIRLCPETPQNFWQCHYEISTFGSTLF